MAAVNFLLYVVFTISIQLWSGVKGQGYLPRPGVILSANSKPAGVLGLRQLYSRSKKWKGNYKADPKSACSIAGSGSLCASAGATDADMKEQVLQLMIATSPAVYSSRNPSDTQVRLLSPADDQQDCNSCTAFAVQAAAEAAVASVLQVDANRVSLSIQSLYYCGDSSGPMQECKSGSTLEAALQQLQARGHNLPTKRCLPYQGTEDITVPPTRDSLCTPLCNTVSELVQKGRFTYKRIIDMWQAQQHIRMYGAVVTRFDVYDDLRPFFDIFSNVQKVYKPGPTAKFKEGHAVALVGYDNDQEFWVVKNSWGPDFADEGYFKVAFNACSVLTEDGIDAYGIIWEPVSPAGAQATGATVLKVWADLKPNCYWYKAVWGDYLSKISWTARIPLDDFMLQNTGNVKDLDAPLAGTMLLLCNPMQGRYQVLPGHAQVPQSSPAPSSPPSTPAPKAASPSSPSSSPQQPVKLPPPPPSSPTPSSSQVQQLCFWDEKEQSCHLRGGIAQQAVKEQPVVLWHKFNLFRSDRDRFCASIKDEASCTAQSVKYKCYWDGSEINSPPADRNFCYAHDYNEGSRYSAGTTLLPERMTCAGSKARDFLRCYGIRSTILCPKVPGCGLFGPGTNRRCYPNWFYDLSSKDADKFMNDFRAFKPEIWGTCEAACFARQGNFCNTTGTTKGACMRHPFCAWLSTSQQCGVSMWDGADPYTKALVKISDQCTALKTKGTCEAKMVKTPQAGKWLDWEAPPSNNFPCDLS